MVLHLSHDINKGLFWLKVFMCTHASLSTCIMLSPFSPKPPNPLVFHHSEVFPIPWSFGLLFSASDKNVRQVTRVCLSYSSGDKQVKRLWKYGINHTVIILALPFLPQRNQKHIPAKKLFFPYSSLKVLSVLLFLTCHRAVRVSEDLRPLPLCRFQLVGK